MHVYACVNMYACVCVDAGVSVRIIFKDARKGRRKCGMYRSNKITKNVYMKKTIHRMKIKKTLK